jgi:hypothetical protein
VDTTDFFGPLYGVDKVPVGDEDLLFYWAIPASREIANFIWDTRVPEVTDPWPTQEPTSLRDAYRIVLGHAWDTGKLYDLSELSAILDRTEVLPVVEAAKTCPNCHTTDCTDKWCGLRGDVDEAGEGSDQEASGDQRGADPVRGGADHAGRPEDSWALGQ